MRTRAQVFLLFGGRRRDEELLGFRAVGEEDLGADAEGRMFGKEGRGKDEGQVAALGKAEGDVGVGAGAAAMRVTGRRE